MGAALFTLALIAVLVGATYLIQFAIWAFYIAVVAAVWAGAAVFYAGCGVICAVWFLIDPQAARETWRQVNGEHGRALTAP